MRRGAIDRHTAILTDYTEDAESQVLSIKSSERLPHRLWRLFARRRNLASMTLPEAKSSIVGGWELQFNQWNASKHPAEGFNEVADAIEYLTREARGDEAFPKDQTEAERLRMTIAMATRAIITALTIRRSS